MLRKMWKRLLNEIGGLGRFGSNIAEKATSINNNFSAGVNPGDPVDSVQFHNPSGKLDGDADFRFKDAEGVLIGEDTKLNMSENGGPADVYWIYNSANDYMELYTDGQLRAQF